MDKRIYIVMGVSGCGKSTLGKLLASSIAVPFYDADDFHSSANKQKMSAGLPLTDVDREGWLEQMVARVDEGLGENGAVLACSALKQAYRERLRRFKGGRVVWIYIKSTPEVVRQRMNLRQGHFFNVMLLQSQFEILEEPMNAVYLDGKLDPQTWLRVLMDTIFLPANVKKTVTNY